MYMWAIQYPVKDAEAEVQEKMAIDVLREVCCTHRLFLEGPVSIVQIDENGQEQPLIGLQ